MKTDPHTADLPAARTPRRGTVTNHLEGADALPSVAGRAQLARRAATVAALLHDRSDVDPVAVLTTTKTVLKQRPLKRPDAAAVTRIAGAAHRYLTELAPPPHFPRLRTTPGAGANLLLYRTPAGVFGDVLLPGAVRHPDADARYLAAALTRAAEPHLDGCAWLGVRALVPARPRKSCWVDATLAVGPLFPLEQLAVRDVA